MNPEKSWTVVQFDDFSVAAVPTNWIQGDFCHWPSYLQNKLNTSIRKCEALNTCWPSHRIKIFRNATFEDYMTARNKAKIAEETSDLASECERNFSKRKRIQRQLSSSDEASDDSLLPLAPKLRKITKSNEIIPQNACVDMRQPQPESMSNRNDPDMELSVLQENYSENDVSHQRHPEKPNNNTSCVFCEKYLRIILEQSHLLRGISSDILSEVRSLKENYRYQEKGDVKSIFVKYSNITFPIQSDSDIEKFEEILNDQENLSEAVNEFAGFGGSNTYGFIKRVMTSIITNDIAKNYSWLGRKGKKPFCRLNISKLILRAAEKGKISENYRKTELAIQSWLKRASERQQRNQQTKKF